MTTPKKKDNDKGILTPERDLSIEGFAKAKKDKV
jgi:hypothetical protein